jgi:hypothetical protein
MPMNQFRIILAASAAMAALAYGVPTAAHPDHSTTKEEVREIKIIKADGDGKKIVVDGNEQKFVADCGKGRKFESSSSSGDDKNKNVSKMVICSDPGESDAEWSKTLNRALADIEGNKDMPAPAKAQIIADLRSEIAKLGK